MPRKTPRVDAFVDESIRGQTYYLCAVLIPFEKQSVLRQELRRISNQFGRRRIHFHNESQNQKEIVLSCICGYITAAIVVRARISHGVVEEMARQTALKMLVIRLQELDVQRFTLESRDDNAMDSSTIQKARRGGLHIDFVHATPLVDELLWAADAVAWSAGNGLKWLKKLASIPIEFLD